MMANHLVRTGIHLDLDILSKVKDFVLIDWWDFIYCIFLISYIDILLVLNNQSKLTAIKFLTSEVDK